MGKDANSKMEDMLECKAIKAVRRVGLQDTFTLLNKKWDYTIPTDVLSKKKESGIRIDYIFCSSDINVLDASIIKNSWTEKASDHYPVTATIEIL